ncbi:MAG: PASTA domain-containing protein [Actinomycetota bacterium]
MAVAAIFGVVVVVLATSLASPSGPDIAEVPDVRGMQFRGAAEILQRAGFTADKVSYAPADEARNGTVLETIPGAGQKLEVGLPIHIVAGALPTTPTPEVVESDSGGRGGERGKGRKNDRDDD